MAPRTPNESRPPADKTSTFTADGIALNKPQVPTAKDVSIPSNSEVSPFNPVGYADRLSQSAAFDMTLSPLPDNVAGSPAAANIGDAAQQATKQAPLDEAITTVFVNNDAWKVQVSFDNKSIDPFVLQDEQLVEVAIEHSIIDPAYLKGYVTVKSKRLGTILNNDELNTEFIFRGDGKDEISFELKPLGAEEDVLPPEIWLTKLDFVVYDVEDIPTPDIHYKRIHFWHKPYQTMRARKIAFSTARYANIPDVRNADDSDRAIPTGVALKHVISEAGLGEYIDTDNWDIGSSSIFYTAPSSSTVEGIMQYILSHHTSEKDSGPCLLYYNRGVNKFQLIAISEFFNKAGAELDKPGEYQIEHFWIQPKDTGTEDAEGYIPIKAPSNNDPESYDRDIKHRDYSIIRENQYTLSDMSGDDSMYALSSRLVHTYDHASKSFIMQAADHEVSNVKTAFKEQYTDKLYPGTSGSPLFVLNNDKTDNLVTHTAYVPSNNKSSQSLLCYGRNNILSNAIFLNLGINFTVPGSSHRHPGRFIGIDKSRNKTDNKYDYKLLGQWFVTSTTFSWKRGQMLNYVDAVKTHTYGDMKFEEKV